MNPKRLATHLPGSMGELIAIAFPLVVSNGCETLMMFTDRLFLARLGPQYMSAAMGGGLTAFMFTTFFVGLIGYANALVAQYLGSGQLRRCGAASGQALLIALAAYPLMLAAIPLGRVLFDAMHVPAEELAPQTTYFTLMMMGSLVGLLRGALSAFFSGIGRTRIVMVAAATCLISNVGLAYVLIFGKLGLPALGITGAAVGTILAGSTGLAILAVAYFRRDRRQTYGTAQGLRLNREVMAKLVKFGSPSGLELMLNITAFSLMILTFHSRGIAVATAVTVAFNWDMVSYIPLIGVNVAVASLVGRSMGAGDPDTAHRATVSATKLVILYASVLVVSFGLFPHVLAGIFLPDSQTEVSKLSVFMVRLISVYIFADALGLVLSGALRGAGDTFVTMCISVGMHWLLLAGTVIALHVLETTVQTAWVVLVMMVWMFCAALYLRYKSGRWRSLRVVES
jgi:MATE family multidrug resistance protein